MIEVIHPSSSSNTSDIDTDSDEEEIGDTIVVRPRTIEPREESEQPIEETQPAKPPTLPTPEDTPEPARRASREIIGNVDPINVVQGSRPRRPTEKVRRQAYFADLDQPEELPGSHAAFRRRNSTRSWPPPSRLDAIITSYGRICRHILTKKDFVQRLPRNTRVLSAETPSK